MTDAPLKNTLVPLVLRLALAAIFIYNGQAKVRGTDNTWGASWATEAWKQRAQPPRDVTKKIEEAPWKAEEIEEVKNRLNVLYGNESTQPPDSIRYAAAQIAVAWGELLGGVALLLGVLTRLAAVGLLIIQVGAILTVTAARGFSVSAGGGAEYNVALIAMCLALVLTGGGCCSVDGILRRRRLASAAR